MQRFAALPSQQPNAEYVHPTKFVGQPDTSEILLDVHHLSPSKTHNSVFIGYIRIDEPGEYVLRTYTDWDRNALWINGKLVSPFRGSIRGGTDPGGNPIDSKERITLEKGLAKIVFVVYAHTRVRNLINLEWTLPGRTMRVRIPAEQLFHREGESDLQDFLHGLE